MKIFIKLIIVILVTVNYSNAQDNYGTTASTFLKFGIGAKSAAMGNAAITTIYEPSAIFWNPALISNINSYSIQLTHNQGFMGSTQNFLGACFPMNYGNIGIAVNYFSSAEMTRTIANSNVGYQEMGTFSNSDLALMASYSKNIFNNMSIGITTKFINQRLDNTSGTAFALDVGLLTKFDLFDLGVSVRNLGTSMKLKNEEYSLPFQVQAGGSANFNEFLFSLAVGTLGENKVTFGIGSEYDIWDIVALRLGYQSGYGDIEGIFKGFTGGMGFNYEGICLDYSFSPYAELGNSHQLSLSYSWGKSSEPKSNQHKDEYFETKPEETEAVDNFKTTDENSSSLVDLYEPGKCYAVLYNTYNSLDEAKSAKKILEQHSIQAIMIVEKIEENSNKTNYQLISGCFQKTQEAVDFLNQNIKWINKELKLTKKAVIIK